MHLEMALGSETRLKVLRALSQEAFPQLELAALSAETGKSLSGIHQAIHGMLATGVLLRERRGRRSVVAMNPAHPWTPILASLFRAERDENNVPHLFPTYWNHLENLTSSLAGHATVRFILLHGSLTRPPIRPTSDIDLLVGIEPGSEPPHHDGRVLGHDVSIVAVETDHLERAIRTRDPFVESVLERHVVLFAVPGQDVPGRGYHTASLVGRSRLGR